MITEKIASCYWSWEGLIIFIFSLKTWKHQTKMLYYHQNNWLKVYDEDI